MRVGGGFTEDEDILWVLRFFEKRKRILPPPLIRTAAVRRRDPHTYSAFVRACESACAVFAL